MSFFDEANHQREKLEKVLLEEDMVLAVHETYPLTLVISRNQAPEAQMAFLDLTNGEDSAPDFSLRFIFKVDGLEVQTDKRMHITDDLLTKLKGLAKKWHTAYTHAFFAEKSMAAQVVLLREKYEDKDAADPFKEFVDDRDASEADDE